MHFFLYIELFVVTLFNLNFGLLFYFLFGFQLHLFWNYLFYFCLFYFFVFLYFSFFLFGNFVCQALLFFLFTFHSKRINNLNTSDIFCLRAYFFSLLIRTALCIVLISIAKLIFSHPCIPIHSTQAKRSRIIHSHFVSIVYAFSLFSFCIFLSSLLCFTRTFTYYIGDHET